MDLKPGMKLFSTGSPAQVVVVKAPTEPVELRCGGQPMALDDGNSDGAPDDGEPLLLGKRYVDAEGGIELLCSRAGAGPLSCDGVELTLKDAKPLPSSD
jgi:hypothetical protein